MSWSCLGSASSGLDNTSAVQTLFVETDVHTARLGPGVHVKLHDVCRCEMARSVRRAGPRPQMPLLSIRSVRMTDGD